MNLGKHRTRIMHFTFIFFVMILGRCSTYTPVDPANTWQVRRTWVHDETAISVKGFVSKIQNLDYLINSPMSPVRLVSGVLQLINAEKNKSVHEMFEQASIFSIIRLGTVVQFLEPYAGGYSIMAVSHPAFEPLKLNDGIGYFTFIYLYGHQGTDVYAEMRFYFNKNNEPNVWYVWKQSVVRFNKAGDIVDSFTGLKPSSSYLPYYHGARKFVEENYPNIKFEKITAD